MFCASNDLTSPPVYLLTADFTAEHIVELTQLFQRNQIPYVLQKETDTLGLPLDRRFFVVVDNIKGTVVLGVQFSSLLMYVVGYPRKGANAKNHYCKKPQQVIEQYRKFSGLPMLQKTNYNTSHIKSKSQLKTLKSIYSRSRHSSQAIHSRSQSLKNSSQPPQSNKQIELGSKINEPSYKDKILLFKPLSEPVQQQYNKFINRMAANEPNIYKIATIAQELKTYMEDNVQVHRIVACDAHLKQIMDIPLLNADLFIYKTQNNPQKLIQSCNVNKQRVKYFDMPEQLIYQLHKIVNKTAPIKLKQKQSKTTQIKRKIQWAQNINNQQAETPIFQINAVHNNSNSNQQVHTAFSKSQNNIGEIDNQFNQIQQSRISKTEKRLPTLQEIGHERNSRILNQIQAQYYQTNSTQSNNHKQKQKSIKNIVQINKVQKTNNIKNEQPPSVVDLQIPRLANSTPIMKFPTASDCIESCLYQQQANTKPINMLSSSKPSTIKMIKLPSTININNNKDTNYNSTKKSIRKIKRAKTENPIKFTTSQSEIVGQMFELAYSDYQKPQKIENIMVSATAPTQIMETVTRHIYKQPIPFPTTKNSKLLRRPYIQPLQQYLPFSPSSSNLIPIKTEVKRKVRSSSHQPQIKLSCLSSIMHVSQPQFHSIASEPKIPISVNYYQQQQNNLNIFKINRNINEPNHRSESVCSEKQTQQLTPASSSGFWGSNGKKIQSNMLQSTFNATQSSGGSGAQNNLCIDSKYTQSMSSSHGFFKVESINQRKPSSSDDCQVQTGNCYNPSVFGTFGIIKSNINQESTDQRSSIISSKGQNKSVLSNNKIYNMAKTMPSNLSFAQPNYDSQISHKFSQSASLYRPQSSILTSAFRQQASKIKSKIKRPLCVLHKHSKQIMNELNSAINMEDTTNNKYNHNILQELKQNLRQHEFQDTKQINKILQYLPNNSQIMLIASSASSQELYDIIQQIKKIQMESQNSSNRITHIFLNSLNELTYEEQQQIRDRLSYNCVLLPPLRPPFANSCRSSRVSSLAKTRNKNIADRLLSVLYDSVVQGK